VRTPLAEETRTEEPQPVSWELAERIAVRVASSHPRPSGYAPAALERDFEELTAQAEELVAAETGLRSLAGPARARVTDRAGWVRANVASFRRLLRPLTERLGARLASTPFAGIGRAATAAQIGTLLGWMSGRVLGQYDLLLIEDESPDEQDLVYYVGPNIVGLERRHGFPPDQFRLWLALHEVTHRAQFTGVPWMRGHFLDLVQASVRAMEPDPRHLLDALRRAIDAARHGNNPLDDGLLALLAGPEQREVLGQIQGLMSLLEGHGDVTMGRAAADLIPQAALFSEVLRQRRANRSGLAKLIQQAIGLDAKLRQYAAGERFIEAVEAAGGTALLNRVWEGPEMVPTQREIAAPGKWVARVAVTPTPAAARP